MDLFEANTQVFILRFWFEHREIEGAHPIWRGMIEHVPTGERHYFRRIDEIPEIILPYLKGQLKDLDQRKSVWQGLKHLFFPKSNKSSK